MKNYFFILILIAGLYGQLNIEKKLYEKIDYVFGIDSTFEELKFQNITAIEYNSSTQYLNVFSPIVNVKLSQSFRVKFKPNIVKNSDLYRVDPASEKFYRFKEFSEFTSYVDEGYIQFVSTNVELNLGRFYDSEGTSLFNNLGLGNQTYHDGLKVLIKYKDINLFSRYYKLSPYRFANKINRHFYQHGLRWNITDELSFSAYETAIEAFENTGINFSYFNPLSIYYANQMNDFKEANINVGFNIKYKRKNAVVWLEFLVDDFQIESENESNLNKEPAEVGILLGGLFKHKPHVFYFNFSLITNRTYNDPYDLNDHSTSYTKYIDRNQIIGYELGSNLLRIEFDYLYSISENFKSSIFLDYLKQGDEAVFNKFDRSYLETETENFPFGKIKESTQIGVRLDYKWDNIRFVGYVMNRSNQSNTVSALFSIGYAMGVY